MSRDYYIVENHLYLQSTAVCFKIGIPLNIFLRETHFYQYEAVVLRLQTFHYLCRPITTQFFIMDPLFKIAINPAKGTPQIPIMNQSPMIVSFFKDKILFGSTNILF